MREQEQNGKTLTKLCAQGIPMKSGIITIFFGIECINSCSWLKLNEKLNITLMFLEAKYEAGGSSW